MVELRLVSTYAEAETFQDSGRICWATNRTIRLCLENSKAPKTAESRTRYFIRQKAEKRGWNVSHPAKGGCFLEENEIVDAFPDIGLGSQRPDFVLSVGGIPIAVIEANNEARMLEAAITEACDYADQICRPGRYETRIAVGAASEEDGGFEVAVLFRTTDGSWIRLRSHGAELTAIPSKAEIEAPLAADDGTTTVSIPDQSEFIDAAIELSIGSFQIWLSPAMEQT